MRKGLALLTGLGLVAMALFVSVMMLINVRSWLSGFVGLVLSLAMLQLLAMTTAMGLYVLPVFKSFTGREAVYFIVTASVGVALLAFSYLELRAHRDA